MIGNGFSGVPADGLLTLVKDTGSRTTLLSMVGSGSDVHNGREGIYGVSSEKGCQEGRRTEDWVRPRRGHRDVRHGTEDKDPWTRILDEGRTVSKDTDKQNGRDSFC